MIFTSNGLAVGDSYFSSRKAFGNASRKHLATLVAGKEVTVKWAKRDRYGRIVGFVIVDGHDVNLVQVKVGMAWF